MREFVKRIPIVGDLARNIYRFAKARLVKSSSFPGSQDYWESRYASGGNSGVGSYDKFAEFKAQVLNSFVAGRGVRSIIEFGSGDGQQLRLARYPKYIGYDVSATAIANCRQLFLGDATKSFELMKDYRGERAAMAMSLDVIYHLVEDQVFHQYMETLFSSAERYVVIYSSNKDIPQGYDGLHVRHRKFTEWIDKNMPKWKLLEHIPNKYPYKGDYREGSFADFYIFCAK